MSELKKGDRTTISVSGRMPFNAVIIGEGRNGTWWWVRRDGRKFPQAYAKSFCRAAEPSAYPAAEPQEKPDAP